MNGDALTTFVSSLAEQPPPLAMDGMSSAPSFSKVPSTVNSIISNSPTGQIHQPLAGAQVTGADTFFANLDVGTLFMPMVDDTGLPGWSSDGLALANPGE
jgi:hypothetical protein